MKKIKLTEDWTANSIGFIMLGCILLLSVPGIINFFNWEDAKNLKDILWPSFSWKTWDELGSKLCDIENWSRILIVFLIYGLFISFAGYLSGKSIKGLWKVYPIVYILTIFSNFIAGNNILKTWGGETVVFCLLLGLIIGNCFNLPKSFKENLTSELFVKIGLILLGSTILIKAMLTVGMYGIIQAIVVIFVVWNFCFWVCKKMGVDREMSVMMSSGVSICGVSAAIATSGAINGDKNKLSYVISLVMVCAIPMIVLLPLIARWCGFSEVLAGAWFGGTIDTTGAVAASGAFYGEIAEKVCTIVKSSQNVLLGVAAFVISMYWTLTGQGDRKEKPTAGVIWERFPKFVIGFVAASLIFSFFIPEQTMAFTKGFVKSAQSFWFALAFTTIGLETNFKQLLSKQNRKATWSFLIAQLFNIFFTLFIAWLLYIVLGGEAQILDKI